MNILNHVDILDLVEVKVFKGMPTMADPAPVRVMVEAKDRGKNVVFDPDALKTLNEKISEIVIGRRLDIKDPNTFKYIEEYVARMVSSLYKNGLLILEDVPEASEDPYADLRKQYKFN